MDMNGQDNCSASSPPGRIHRGLARHHNSGLITKGERESGIRAYYLCM